MPFHTFVQCFIFRIGFDVVTVVMLLLVYASSFFSFCQSSDTENRRVRTYYSRVCKPFRRVNARDKIVRRSRNERINH